MLFYEINFILSFVVFFAIYISARDKYRNSLIVLVSYLFYSMWDWRFLSLLILSTVVDYFVSNLMREGCKSRNKKLLIVSIFVNIGALALFKYYNFFAESFISLFSSFGLSASPLFLDVILPAGISFYTFQTLSYTIDVYKGKIKAEKNFVNFSAYVAFFPQLVAGPIERAENLLVQINKTRKICISDFFIGLRLFGWGLFKKIVVADNLAAISDPIFSNPGAYDSISLVFAVYAFAFQIYCDFSGYTDMARGLAKMMGFNLSINFNLPYFSTSITDFWRRWHITLSSWIRDYIYIPLGGNRKGKTRMYANLLTAMFLCGLWHGAGLNYIILYGGYIMALYSLLKRLQTITLSH
jgi:alginate O-acetyltransferase complex protein AlgI